MISRKPTGTIIHFREKLIDQKILVRYTTDFLMSLFALAQKKRLTTETALPDSTITDKHFFHEKIKHSHQKEQSSITESKNNSCSQKLPVAVSQAKMLAKISEYANILKLENNCMVDIRFDENQEIPVVRSYSSLRNNGMLLMVTFQKVDWNEINIFRGFLVRYLTHYLEKQTAKSSEDIRHTVINLSFVVQEFLQNANLYGTGDYGYELVISHVNDAIIVSVENYTEHEHAQHLKAIIDEINTTENIRELVLKYMLSSHKHLGLISSVFNYYVSDINCKIKRDCLVRLEAKIPFANNRKR